MVISSRTPEGEPNQCPVCGKHVRIDPSPLFGDAPCPNCGHLLWFYRLEAETRISTWEESSKLRLRLIEAIATRCSIAREKVTGDPRQLENLGMNSLDVVELVIQLEEEGFLQ